MQKYSEKYLELKVKMIDELKEMWGKVKTETDTMLNNNYVSYMVSLGDFHKCTEFVDRIEDMQVTYHDICDGFIKKLLGYNKPLQELLRLYLKHKYKENNPFNVNDVMSYLEWLNINDNYERL